MVVRYVGVVLIMCLAIVSGGSVFAETWPNVVGDWDATVKRVTYDNDTEDYAYSDVTSTIHIIDQSGRLFYGNIEFQKSDGSGTGSSPITGVITGRKNMIITWSAVTLNVTLTGYDKNERLYTKWESVGNSLNLGSSGGGQVATYATAIRR